MTLTYEDFVAFLYPSLFLLAGLLSLIPAYVASSKNKKFWHWWLGTLIVFAFSLLVMLQTQTMSGIIYLLAIVFVASILAFVPTSDRKNIVVSSRSTFWEALTGILIVGAVLYLYLTYESPSLPSLGAPYRATLALVILSSGLGLAFLIFMVYGKKLRDILLSIFLTSLLLWFFLLQGWNIYFKIMQVLGTTGATDLFSPLLYDLASRSNAGIFILIGLCSGCIAFGILLVDKFDIVRRIVSLSPPDVRRIIFVTPNIKLSKNPRVSTYILVGVFLFRFFVRDFNLGEAGIFLWPLYYICVGFPMILVSFAGIVLSSVVIGKSISQNKPLYAAGILLCGLLATWSGVSTNYFMDYFGLPGTLLLSYSAGSGFVALILWVISDYRGDGMITIE